MEPLSARHLDSIRTGLVTTGSGLEESLELRRERIAEPLRWPPGTRESPKEYVVNTLAPGVNVGFRKPGKEVDREATPGPYDMTPFVGSGDAPLPFKGLWAKLASIGEKDADVLKVVSVLIYRSAFLLDHRKEKEGIRYSPNAPVMEIIQIADKGVGTELSGYGLWGFLNLLDVVGWNEDIKYHPDWAGLPPRPRQGKGPYPNETGRVNTLLSVIRVPWELLDFVNQVRLLTKAGGLIDYGAILQMSQHFASSRGVAPARQNQLTRWLTPYIVRELPAQVRTLDSG